MRFFFYGTLLDRDVAALVLGRRLPPEAYEPANLPCHSRWRAEGASYPVVVRDPRGTVRGAIVRGLNNRDVARLAIYEGPGYRVEPLRVVISGKSTIVSVFAPIVENAGVYRDGRLKPSREPWDLGRWQQRHKRPFVTRLRQAFSVRPACSRP